jgi:hypothetical protein
VQRIEINFLQGVKDGLQPLTGNVRLLKLLVRAVVERLSVGAEDQAKLIKIWQSRE